MFQNSDGTNGLKRPGSVVSSDDEPANKRRVNEVEKLWKNVNDNPSDFQAWTLLLQHVDQMVSFCYRACEAMLD